MALYIIKIHCRWRHLPMMTPTRQHDAVQKMRIQVGYHLPRLLTSCGCARALFEDDKRKKVSSWLARCKLKAVGRRNSFVIKRAGRDSSRKSVCPVWTLNDIDTRRARKTLKPFKALKTLRQYLATKSFNSATFSSCCCTPHPKVEIQGIFPTRVLSAFYQCRHGSRIFSKMSEHRIPHRG